MNEELEEAIRDHLDSFVILHFFSEYSGWDEMENEPALNHVWCRWFDSDHPDNWAKKDYAAAYVVGTLTTEDVYASLTYFQEDGHDDWEVDNLREHIYREFDLKNEQKPFADEVIDIYLDSMIENY